MKRTPILVILLSLVISSSVLLAKEKPAKKTPVIKNMAESTAAPMSLSAPYDPQVADCEPVYGELLCVTVLSPNGGEIWYVGHTKDITWNVYTDILEGVDSLKIYYSTNIGSDWTLLATQDSTQGIYAWTIPDTLTDGALVKVVAYGEFGASGEDVSDDVFDIARLDTIWLGADPTGTSVVEGGVWDFDNRGTLTCSAEDEPEVYIKNGAFAQGWTSEDTLAQKELYWHAEDFTDLEFACSTNPIAGSYSAWCGRLAAAPDECFNDAPGYGHDWRQWMCRTVTLDPVTPRLTYKFNSDTEPGFDYGYLIIDSDFPDSCGWVGDNADTIRCYDGPRGTTLEDIDLTNLAADPDLCDLFPTSDYSGDSVKVCFVVVSDARWDDEDGEYATCDGAFTVDDISIDVSYSSGDMIATDFEDGTLGGWEACGGFSPGDYAAIRDRESFINNDPNGWQDCGMEGCVLTFFNPDTPGEYGNGGHYAGLVHNRAWSPAVDLAAYPSGEHVIRYDLYADLPIPNWIFYRHYVRYVQDTNCPTGAWSQPLSDGYVYYSAAPECTVRVWDFPSLVPIDADSVKIGVSVWSGRLFYEHPYTEGNESPIFDNVRLGIVGDFSPDVTVLTPNGGEIWYIGDTEDITWTATDGSGVDSVSVYYSTNNGGDWTLLASEESNDGFYPWTIPDTPTEAALVKVAAYDPNPFVGEDVSDAVFWIAENTPPVVAVTAPNGGETWYAGDSEDIEWTATDASGVDSVSIYYSTNSGGDWTLLASQEPNDGTYSWTIPDTPTETALVKVEAYDHNLNVGEDVSDAVFTIVDNTPPAVTVTAPNGGETWYVGDTEDITWTATDASGVDSVSIYYSTNSGGDWTLLASQEPNDGTYPWIIPDTPTGNALVKVEAYDHNLNVGEDVSDAVFTIVESTPPAVTVTAPNGGETWYVGDTEDITWTATDASGVDSVSVYYSTNNGGDWTLLASQEPNDGTYPWMIPDTPTGNALVKVEAYDHNLNVGEDVSDAVFTIVESTPPAVTVTAPNGGESWYVGDTEDITWTATDASGVDSVSIYYSTNGGADWILLASQEPNDGTYPWTIPSTPTDSAVVKVIAYDSNLNAGEDVSDGLFAITVPDVTDPVVAVLAPNGGEIWYVGDTEDITWTATDASGVDSVVIYYSTNGGGDYTLIASGESNDGVYSWTLPDTPTVSALVKVEAYDPSLNTGQDESDAVFTIADGTSPVVTVLAPNGGETWYACDSEDITWTATDASGIDSVSIYYSLNGGWDYTLIASGEANDGTYLWTVPDTPSDSALVSIVAYDPDLNAGIDTSDAMFEIAPQPVAQWMVDGDQGNAQLGYSVSSAGDVNGDGYDDVIVGAYLYDNGEADEGRAYAYHGSATGLSAEPAWTAESDQAGAKFGCAVSSAGDVNGDGYDDVIVGAEEYDSFGGSEGRAYVYHGSPSGLSATAAWTAECDQASASFGSAVSSAGDVNGDGYDDVIVGAYAYGFFTGRAYVYHGSASGLSATAAWMIEGDQGFAQLGNSVSGAGDVNGDGYDDVIVGAQWYTNGESNEGRAYVYHGSASGLSVTAAWTGESDQAGAHYGESVSSAGDVDSDGYGDVIVGAGSFNTVYSGEGRAYVYHGGPGGLSSLPDWTADGDQTNASLGTSVSCAGDVNGDGNSDVIIGAELYNNGESHEGRAFVYRGGFAGLSATADSTMESDQVNAAFGHCVSTAGDVNGDGNSDLIVGAHGYDHCDPEEGCAFVYYGPFMTVDVPEEPGRKYTNELLQNYPNPFRMATGTTILYSVESPGRAALRICDANGRLVRTIFDRAEVGDNRLFWDGKADDGARVPSGVYFCQLRVGGFTSHRKMMLVE